MNLAMRYEDDAADRWHVPVMVEEVCGLLSAHGPLAFVDVTVGTGGHAEAMLRAARARMLGLDRDAAALAVARDRLVEFGDRVVLGGGEQRAETREPDLGMRPQPMLVETGDFPQGIVSATMGVAGEIIQRLEFPEDRDIDRGSESFFQFAQGGDLAAQQKHTQFIGAEGEGSHNVIVPTVPFLLIGTITYRHAIRHDIGKTQETCFLGY